MIYFCLWIFVTLVVATVALGFTKRFGPSFAVGLYVGALATAIVVAGKLGIVSILGRDVVLSASIVVFAATFLITDVIAEIYGRQVAKIAVWSGTALYPLLFVNLYFSIGFPPETLYDTLGKQDAFVTTMEITGRVVVASFIAFLAGQLHDVWAFHFWKQKTGGRHLWLRNNLSTWGSQLIDTLVFYTVAFYGVFPISELIVATYLVKVVISILDTPFIYAVVWFIRHRDTEHFTEQSTFAASDNAR